MPKGIRDFPVPYVCTKCGTRGATYATGVLPALCDDCKRERKRQHSANARERDPEANSRHQFRHRMVRYGLDPEVMEGLAASHNGLCAACERPGDHVDHCHVTGGQNAFRGFLCPSCNRVLGLVFDDPARLRSLAAYLERHRAASSQKNLNRQNRSAPESEKFFN